MRHPEDYAVFSAKITVMAETYGKQASTARIQLYWDLLKRYSWNTVEAAINATLTAHQYPTIPTPGQIIKAMSYRVPDTPMLTEPEPTERDLARGRWRCKWALWMSGVEKSGTKLERQRGGGKQIKPVFRSIGESKWKQVEGDAAGAERLFLEFLETNDGPDWLVAEVKENLGAQV